jgi:cytochrome c2
MRKIGLVLMLVLSLVVASTLTACGGDSAPAEGEGEALSGDPATGETVFNEVAAPACNTCHSLEPDVTQIGPSLASVGSLAGTRVEGVSAADYLRESITAPDSYVVEGFAPGIMTNTYEAQLSEQQMDDLVAYLLTLK